MGISEIKMEEGIIAFIENRDKQIQNTLDNYFFIYGSNRLIRALPFQSF